MLRRFFRRVELIEVAAGVAPFAAEVDLEPLPVDDEDDEEEADEDGDDETFPALPFPLASGEARCSRSLLSFLPLALMAELLASAADVDVGVVDVAGVAGGPVVGAVVGAVDAAVGLWASPPFFCRFGRPLLLSRISPAAMAVAAAVDDDGVVVVGEGPPAAAVIVVDSDSPPAAASLFVAGLSARFRFRV